MGFENKRDIYDDMEKRTEAITRMVERDLTHYDDVFDLLDIYYSNGFDSFRSALENWVGINHR